MDEVYFKERLKNETLFAYGYKKLKKHQFMITEEDKKYFYRNLILLLERNGYTYPLTRVNDIITDL